MKNFRLKFLSFFIVAMLIITPIASIASVPVTPAFASGGNLIVNGDFGTNDLSSWWSYGLTSASGTGGDLAVDMPGSIGQYSAGVGQDNVAVLNGTEYVLRFTASAVPDATVHVVVQNPDTTHNYTDQTVNLTSTPTTFTYIFTADEDKATAKLIFQLGGATAFIGHFDDISLIPLGTEKIANGDFGTNDLSSWWSYGLTSASGTGGDMAVDMPGSIGQYSAGAGQDNVAMLNGNEYVLRFTASAVPDATVHVVVQNPDTTHNYTDQTVNLTSTPTTFTYIFTADEDKATAKLIFQLGGATAFIGHFDDISLKGPADSTPPPTSNVPTHIGELLKNGTFSNALTTPWFSNGATTAVNESRLEASITNGNANAWDAIVGQTAIPVFDTTETPESEYRLTLKAWASANMTVTAILQKDGAPYTAYFSQALALTTTPKTFTFTFDTAVDDPAAVLQFQMGAAGDNTVYLDNISLNGPEPVSHMDTGAPLILNGDFASGTNPWWNTAGVSIDASSGAMVATVTSGGVNPYDVIIGHNNVTLLEGGNYTLDFDAWASTPLSVTTLLQLNGSPYTGYFSAPVALTTSSQPFHYTFTSAHADPSAGFQFQLGSNGPFVFYVDNIVLLGPKPTPPTEFASALRANQNGYLPNAEKIATLATDITSPLAWTLYDGSSTPVASGMTTIFGNDTDSGEHVHSIDFSSFTTPGSGYTLEAYGETSHPFTIGSDVYSVLKYDALAYFYQTRAGIAIEMPYAGRADLEHPAGHIGVSPNQGDTSVTCFDQVDVNLTDWEGCSYSLNVSKGWYDAGDHGKYVVNGGISVWTLLNQYERAKYLGSNQAAFADGEMNIPENANGVPDILDEARWEVEFMLSMQVPSGGMVEGEDLSGMVHHKLHDKAWTGLGLSPDQDPQPRYLYPPSTAATLNMAAVAAQCARIWATIDPTFSTTCLNAAETAWAAAVAHPAVYAANNFTGGGPYDDTDVTDEFYWAASELFVTTGDSQYSSYIAGSSHYLDIPSGAASGLVLTGNSMGWPKVQALGTISLAIVPNSLAPADVQTAWTNITTVADGYAAAVSTQGYTLPYMPEGGGYQWGSNSDVLNNMIILGLAYDHTQQSKYLEAVTQGMDYILGHNPNDKSYISGYGENPLVNPHHRFWAPSLGSFPLLPPGIVSGGPDSALQDPYILTIFPGGCSAAPQKCYVDHLESYSTNEITVNWNAPLAWVTAFIDDAATNPVIIITPTPTVTATSEITSTPTATSVITVTPTPTRTRTSTPVVTPSRTSTITKTPTKTVTRTVTKTATKTVTPTATPVVVTLTSNATQDGWVLESGENSNVGGALNAVEPGLSVGDDVNNRQYRSILSFVTNSIPDNAIITRVLLKVKRVTVIGAGDPFSLFNGLMFDVKNGFFGPTPDLQLADFQAVASATYGPSLTPSFVNNIYTFNLTNSAVNINKLTGNQGVTQIRLRFNLDDNNNALANVLRLYSANAVNAADRPQLVITYKMP